MVSTVASRVMTLLVAAQVALCVAGVATVLLRDRAEPHDTAMPQISDTTGWQGTARS